MHIYEMDRFQKVGTTPLIKRSVKILLVAQRALERAILSILLSYRVRNEIVRYRIKVNDAIITIAKSA